MSRDEPRFVDVFERVGEKAQAFCDLSDRLWHAPELAFNEDKSAEAHIQALEAEGFRIHRKCGGLDTAFMAEYGSSGPVLAFLGEYDALPELSQQANLVERSPVIRGGAGHGCGHNLLGAGSALAAVALKDALSNAGLPGIIRYYGCPAEESGSGKAFMARAGVFDDADVAFCWHPNVVNQANTSSSLAFYQCRFRFEGRSAHAAVSPELGRSALDAVELMNVGVNYLREHMPSDARIHYAVTRTGGDSPNVVQADAEVLYLIRSPHIADAEQLLQRVTNCAKGAALMTETAMSSQITDAGMNLLPNRVLLQEMHKTLVQSGGPGFDQSDFAFADKLRQAALAEADIKASVAAYDPKLAKSVLHEAILDLPSAEQVQMASTDVGDVSWVVPTVQCNTACFAIGTAFHTWQLVSQGTSAPAHKGMILAAKAMAGTALSCILDPNLIAEAKAELRERTGGLSYACPIPDEVTPEHLRMASAA